MPGIHLGQVSSRLHVPVARAYHGFDAAWHGSLGSVPGYGTGGVASLAYCTTLATSTTARRPRPMPTSPPLISVPVSASADAQHTADNRLAAPLPNAPAGNLDR